MSFSCNVTIVLKTRIWILIKKYLKMVNFGQHHHDNKCIGICYMKQFKIYK